MSIFNDGDTAWSMLTRAFELRAGDPGAPLIVQSNSILMPLECLTKWPKLNTYRKLRVGDVKPVYQRVNTNQYVSSDARVSDGYDTYVNALNVALRAKYPQLDQKEADKRLKQVVRATDDLGKFLKGARLDWKAAQAADPTLTYVEWDKEYGFSVKKKLKDDTLTQAYGSYQALVAQYPDLYEAAQGLRSLLDPTTKVALPMDQSEVDDDPGSWSTFYKTYLVGDFDEFMKNTVEDTLLINEQSSRSSSYDSRWSASGSFGYGFFGVDVTAGGGTSERHLREDSKSVSVKFKNLQAFPVNRGTWYKGNLVSHGAVVDPDMFWRKNGELNLIPLQVIIGRGLTVEIETSKRAYDSFATWYSQTTNAGFSFGPWRIGGSVSTSSSRSEVSNQSSGTTIRIEDTSNKPFIISVISYKMDEIFGRPEFLADFEARMIGMQAFDESRRHELDWVGAVPVRYAEFGQAGGSSTGGGRSGNGQSERDGNGSGRRRRGGQVEAEHASSH